MTNANRDENNIPTIIGTSSIDGVTPIPVEVNPVTWRMKINVTWGSSPLTTKWDLFTFDTGDARLWVWTDWQTLTADSSEPTGLKWGNGGSWDMLAATYDPTSVAWDAFDMDNMVEWSTNLILTSAERTKITNTSWTNTGDQTSIVWISWTTAQFNTALSDWSFATGWWTATWTNTWDQTTVSWNAWTATALETARTIWWTSFDWTANIAIWALNSTNVWATTSAELAWVISDETWSWSLVFATSPTLTTPVLWTPASWTLTNCDWYTESLIIAISDETTDLTTWTAKATFRMPYAFTLTDVRASVTTAPTWSVATFDINESWTTILSTKITIDATEKTSTTAATAPVISDSALADDAEITIDIDTIWSTVAWTWAKIYLIWYKT